MELSVPPGRLRDAFELEGRLVEPGRNKIVGPTGERAVEPKVMDVLCVLAERDGGVATRGELIDEVWGRTHGTDESLTRAISLLRKAVGDVDRDGLIQTVSKRGYRINGVIRLRPATQAAISVPAASRKISILILTLAIVVVSSVIVWVAQQGVDRGRAPLRADGIPIVFDILKPSMGKPLERQLASDLSRQLSASLSRGSLLRVIPQEDRGLAQPATSATLWVSGVVSAEGDRLRVGLALRDGLSGQVLWARDYDRSRSLDARAQDALGQAMAAELYNRILIASKAKLRSQSLSDLKPWQLNLLATWVPGSDEVFLHPHQSGRFWPQVRALQLDPSYAPAHATLSSGLSYDALLTPPPISDRWLASASQHAQEAAALGPFDADVLYALATYSRQIGRRDDAIGQLSRVVAVQPDHPTAALDKIYVEGLCTSRGEQSAAALEGKLAAMSDDNPIRWVILSHLADIHLAQGEYALASAEATASRRVVKSTWNGLTLAMALSATGDVAGATRVSRELKLEWPDLNWRAFASTSLPKWCLGSPPPPQLVAAATRIR